MDKVNEFWGTQARIHGADSRATAPDFFYRETEIARIIDHLPDSGTVLDVGCGNGYSTLKFAAARPDLWFVGMDFSTDMIKASKAADPDQHCEWWIHDIRKSLPTTIKFDTIVSTRCLINLANWEEQKLALLNMKAVLAPKGKIILVENVIDGLHRLNDLRKLFDLPQIQVRWHNHYLPKKELVDYCSKLFNIEHFANIGGMYYLISRVIYAALAEKNGEALDYGHPLNELAAKLPYMACPYSPNMLFLLRNK